MPRRSKGSRIPSGFQSKSTPNLPTLSTQGLTVTSSGNAVHRDAPELDSPSQPASIEDNISDGSSVEEPPSEYVLEQESSSSLEEEEEDGSHRGTTMQRPLYTHASRSYTSLPLQSQPSMLFPPFYNRPPAPLPPSPSLTSIFRSAQASRATTPDSSDIEFGDNGASGTATPISTTTTTADINKSARLAPTSIPRATPKVPTYEYYGFALYLASSAAFFMYLLWSFLPSPFLHQLGIYYYPNRWWALAVPAWLVMLIIYIYIALASYNTQHLTLRMSNCENLIDEAGAVACIDPKTKRIVKNGVAPSQTKNRVGNSGSSKIVTQGFVNTKFAVGQKVDWKSLWNEGTDAVLDVPIGGVCEILYGEGLDE